MARAIKKYAISFGMVVIPVALYSATSSEDVAFNTLHKAECRSRLKQKRWCPVHDREVFSDEIQRAYELTKDSYVDVTDEDLEQLPLGSKDTIDLTTFVDAAEIDPVYFEKSYWLVPDKIGVKPYAMLHQALVDKQRVAVAKITIKTKEALCCLRASDDAIMLCTLYFPDELRQPEKIPTAVVSSTELTMAQQLVEAYTEPFEPEKYHDNYREALLELIAAKNEGRELPQVVAPAPEPEMDLMAVMRASIEAKKAEKARGAA